MNEPEAATESFSPEDTETVDSVKNINHVVTSSVKLCSC